MDLLIALSQGLGLAVAAGFVGAPPVAIGATAASADVADSSASVADDSWLLIVAWVAAAGELVADAVWPGAQAGVRLARKAAGGGLAFGLVAWDELPWVSLVLGALIAAAVAVALRHVRAGAVKAGGDLRGTALIEDVSGFADAKVDALLAHRSQWRSTHGIDDATASDGIERFRVREADDLVRDPAQPLARLAGADRRGDHDPGRFHLPQGQHRGVHRRSGRESIVHEDHRAIVHERAVWQTAAAIKCFASFKNGCIARPSLPRPAY